MGLEVGGACRVSQKIGVLFIVFSLFNQYKTDGINRFLKVRIQSIRYVYMERMYGSSRPNSCAFVCVNSTVPECCCCYASNYFFCFCFYLRLGPGVWYWLSWQRVLEKDALLPRVKNAKIVLREKMVN